MSSMPMEQTAESEGSSGVTISPITVYWRPGCPYCSRLRLGLQRAGIPVDEVNIWEEPSAAAIVRSIAGGNETVPTVVVGSTAMVNPSPRRVIKELQAQSLDLSSLVTNQHTSSRSIGTGPLRVLRWVVLAALIAASVVSDALGHGAASWAFDGLAIATLLGFRVLRRNAAPAHRVPQP